MKKTNNNEIRIRVQCTAEENHGKILRFDAGLISLSFIESFARLIDGTHPAYVHPPNPGKDAPEKLCRFCNEIHASGRHSCIGRCAVCGATLECRIENLLPLDPVDLAAGHRASLEDNAEHSKPVN